MFESRPHRFYPRQSSNATDANGCLICDDTPPQCNCPWNQECIIINRDCHTCPSSQCVANTDTGSSKVAKGGVSKGAVAGAVVVAIVLLAAAVGAYFWYRRRQQRLLQQNTASQGDTKPDVPARAEDVLNRPDPNEKPPSSPPPQLSSIRIYSGGSHGMINLDPATSDAGHSEYQYHQQQQHPSHRGSVQSNPFEDNHSIQTTSTGAQSNVIPIALVPPRSVGNSSGPSGISHSHDNHHAAHARPDVNLDHVNVSNDSLNPRSVASGRANDNNNTNSNNRSSFMTTGSFSSDFLETSVIVTPTRGTVKQVVGVAKAEVLRTPPSDSLSRSSTMSKQARSPLAASSFGPADIMHEVQEEQEVTVPANPFSDTNSPYTRTSPTPSATTFGSPEPSHASYSRQESHADSPASWLQEDPGHLYGNNGSDSRPASVYTQASAIVADISSAKRVHLGFDQIQAMPTTPLSAALSTPRSPYRMTNAKLALPYVPPRRRIDDPVAAPLQALSRSNRLLPIRAAVADLEPSYPHAAALPLAQQSFASAQDEHHVSASETVNRARASASASSTLSGLVPPRKTHAMSVASQSSSVSTGLGSFPFHIDAGVNPSASASTAGTRAESTASSGMNAPPSAFSATGSDGSSMRKRASLDTLALTSDLSSYPLGFDKTNAPPVPQVPRR
ncbi:hypothetical protein BN946_scf184760.g12 [Trametes cinnabarina]|uniref:Membrane anchor Opy2 N-terminal domain-containing protein n=1 Tax=Pycnoporus cinnabarinus TaxID=5643 RepID=A0A060S2R4_PYCCI|nr:hypothetical protein BN946_scf184760.g12 [Trametes cinnabarina]